MLKPNNKIILIIFLILLFTFSFVKTGTDINNLFPNGDKVFHAIAYFIFTLLTLFYYPDSKKLKIIFLIFLTGVLIEILQWFYGHGRQFSLYDIAANTVGITLAIVISVIRFLKYSRIRKNNI